MCDRRAGCGISRACGACRIGNVARAPQSIQREPCCSRGVGLGSCCRRQVTAQRGAVAIGRIQRLRVGEAICRVSTVSANDGVLASAKLQVSRCTHSARASNRAASRTTSHRACRVTLIIFRPTSSGDLSTRGPMHRRALLLALRQARRRRPRHMMPSI